MKNVTKRGRKKNVAKMERIRKQRNLKERKRKNSFIQFEGNKKKMKS